MARSLAGALARQTLAFIHNSVNRLFLQLCVMSLQLPAVQRIVWLFQETAPLSFLSRQLRTPRILAGRWFFERPPQAQCHWFTDGNSTDRIFRMPPTAFLFFKGVPGV